MQIEQIDTFLDLIETRSFHRTAERLGLTQSTVSARLVALEQAVGARLFTRSRAGAQLTTEGLKLEPHARLLRQEWTMARRAVLANGTAALTLRIGVQNDLAPAHLGALVADFRALLPQAALYIEPDYSTQMCADLVTGTLDVALLFTPKPQPDLYFESLAELPYRLISTRADTLATLAPETYVSANFSPAFEAAHRQLLPHLAATALSVGQSSAVALLLAQMGGAGYVMDSQARALTAAGGYHLVPDAPVIHQPVYGAIHLRNRTATTHKRLMHCARRRLNTPGAR
ncbi:LysR family transcriptional regulator [Pseudorhodobacter sp. MZDSW-24AT]|uniref:LysR family transcriptional regulator n=1 Tax=Pseudorhodobacter sp. MZDSW-24AT TaxID=2052957 RepID=UPI000C1EF77E|nr:LysR family transcriptional regulator [Pseudorhodobacter sp. MZDSW-24AT]PJF08271.1 LysR family transcriptional regulator [Pseudorhodobacter sp. MZDSW-24AT]